MAWHMGEEGHFELLQKMWVWAQELQLKPEELRNPLWLSKDNSGKRTWHKAPSGSKAVLETLLDYAKILQHKPEELR
jgi:hypothetical protein